MTETSLTVYASPACAGSFCQAVQQVHTTGKMPFSEMERPRGLKPAALCLRIVAGWLSIVAGLFSTIAMAVAVVASVTDRVQAETLPPAELARHARYDEAVARHRERMEQATDPAARVALAAEFASLLEQLGEVAAAIPYYELVVAEGSFDEWTAQRLDARLQRCRRQRASRVTFPVSVEARDAISQIEALLAGRQWTAALAAMQNLLERFGDTFLQREPGHYEGIWHWAQNRLADLPSAGQTADAEFTKAAWREAREKGSTQAFGDLIRSHPASRVSQQAWLAWAETAADQGRLSQAIGLLDRLSSQNEQREQRRRAWLALLDPAVASTAAMLSPETVLEALTKAPSIPLAAHEDAQIIGVAADRERIYIHRPFRVEAYDRKTAHPCWQYNPVEPTDRQDLVRDVFRKSQRPKDPWAGGMDPLPVVASPAGVLIVETYHRGDVEHVYSVVTCLDASSGRQLWTLAADPLFQRLRVCSDPVFDAGTVLFTAASRGEFPEFFLCAVDASDGHLTWRKQVAAAGSPTQCLGRGMIYAGRSGPTLCADGPVVYYATHMGAVVAIDRDLGQLLWAITYPRVTRIGPLTHAPLALLERRTEAMRVTPSRLVLMPRDFNGVLVIDRKTATLVRSIPSLDVLSLVWADDHRAIATTLSGEIRCWDLGTGEQAWAWNKSAGASAAYLDGQVLVTSGRQLVRLDAASGDQIAAHDLPEPVLLRPGGADGVLAGLSQDSIQLLSASGGSPPPVQLPPLVLRSGRKRSIGDGAQEWRHSAFIPGRGLDAHLVADGESHCLVVADGVGLSCFNSVDDFQLRWWRAFDGHSGIWSASMINPDKPTAGIVVTSSDREQIDISAPATGRLMGSGKAGVTPIRSLHAVEQVAIAVGTSSLAGLAAAADGTLQTRWSHDLSPCVFEAIYPGEPITSVLVQPGGDQPGRLLRIDSRSGNIAGTFTLVVPRPTLRGEHYANQPERYPISLLRYTQQDLRRNADQWNASGYAGALEPGPLLALARRGNLLLLDILDYRGVVDLTTGEVVLVSPYALRDLEPDPSPVLDFLLAWQEQNSTFDRIMDIPFYFDEQGLTLGRDLRLLAEYEGKPYISQLRTSAGQLISLGATVPQHMEVTKDQALIQGQRGLILLRRNSPGGPVDGTTPAQMGKDPATLFEPRAVRVAAADDLQLDGHFDDWPTDGWSELTPGEHLVRFAGADAEMRRAGPETGKSDESRDGLQARFQWARHNGAHWLAVMVRDERHTAASAAASCTADRVEILMRGCKPSGRRNNPDRPNHPVALVTLFLGDGMPMATIASQGAPLQHGLPVGFGNEFENWLGRRYAASPTWADEVACAIIRDTPYTKYELRLEDSFFEVEGPRGFDLRVVDVDGTEPAVALQWGGALVDRAACPLAAFVPAEHP
jgi:outer membrane protein assembly factor BamB